MKPAVSVIVPTFNRAAYVREAVLSVLNQTFASYELIVWNDGSTDGTATELRRIARLYPRAPLRIMGSDENRGPSFARNRAVERASGEYVAFLDSDDLWLKNKLKIQHQFMADSRMDICQTDEIWIRNGRRVNPCAKHRKPSGMIFAPSLDRCLVSPSAVMMKTDFFLRHGGFDERLPACEDYDLWLRITLRHPVGLIDRKLVVKRGGHQDQLSRTVPHLDRFRIASMEKILLAHDPDESEQRMIHAALAEKCRICAAGLTKRNRHAEASYYEDIARRHAS